MGWTPLMIAASVKDGEKLVEFLLSKGADPNETSELAPTFTPDLMHGCNEQTPQTTQAKPFSTS